MNDKTNGAPWCTKVLNRNRGEIGKKTILMVPHRNHGKNENIKTLMVLHGGKTEKMLRVHGGPWCSMERVEKQKKSKGLMVLHGALWEA